jgi:hypothetical protein
VAAVPAGVHRSLIGMVLSVLSARSQVRSNRPSRVAAAVREHVLTFAAMAAITVGMFHLGFTLGCVSVGVSLFLADFKIQG